jgi:hypothetical protein
MHYGDDRLALYIDDVRRTNRVTAARLANEASRWGTSKARATAIIADLLDRAPEAIAAARDETVGVPSELVATVESQLTQLRGSNT